MSEGAILSVHGLGKRFDRRWLFRDLEFRVDFGQSLAILGPNGSGKSTLARVVAGLIPATEGKVRIQGSMAMMAVDQSVYPQLNVWEHLELFGDLLGKPGRSEVLMDRVGLGSARERLGHQLSTGMRARLKLALALLAEPSVLILDEPGASLDEDGHRLVESVVEEQRARGVTLIATNDSEERRLATHELVLET
jgi:ABC-type multidrug transport system ATPase subunit